jgi:hypothetical protein
MAWRSCSSGYEFERVFRAAGFTPDQFQRGESISAGARNAQFFALLRIDSEPAQQLIGVLAQARRSGRCGRAGVDEMQWRTDRRLATI